MVLMNLRRMMVYPMYRDQASEKSLDFCTAPNASHAIHSGPSELVTLPPFCQLPHLVIDEGINAFMSPLECCV